VNGNRAIAKILKAEGVEWLAAFPMNGLLDEAAKEGIRPIICRQERAGVNIADGFSRTTNGKNIGVFVMQYGAGAENAFGGVAQAYADSIPVLLLPGGQRRDRAQTHPNFQSTPNYQGVTKWAGEINLVERIPEFMHMAFSQLRHGRPGPVIVEVPDDLGGEEYPADEVDYTPVKTYRSAADDDDVRNLVEDLLAASCPVICAGHGVMWAEATQELVEFAELAKIPVMTSLCGKSGFPESHALALGAAGNTGPPMISHFLNKADLVLGIGTGFSKTNFTAPIPPGVILGLVTNCGEEIGKDHRISCGALGDARIVLRQMIEEVKRQTTVEGRPDTAGVVAEVASVKSAFLEEWGPRLHSDEIPINPYRVITELARAVDVDNTIITHDSGYPRNQMVPFWECNKPRGYIGWGKSTQLGYGLGLAIGAKLAAPEKTVVNVMGDAAFGMAGLDIETAVRASIPIMTVVLNNGVMTEYSSYLPYIAEHHDANKLGGEYAKLGEALGAYAERVESPDELVAAFQRGMAANDEGRPALIEVMVKEEAVAPKF
jgi:thiamine pyrophosphate-dependent acetolactate synthase large subunit-like protein